MKSKIGIIIGREFKERVQKKSFIITTLLTPLLMIALMFAPMLIAGYSGESEKRIAVVDDSKIIAQQLQNTDEIKFEATPLPIELARKEYDNWHGVLHIGKDIMENPADVRMYTNGTSSMSTEHNVQMQVTMAIQAEKMKKHNIDSSVMQDLHTGASLQSMKNETNEKESASSTTVATVLAYVLSFLLYMFLILYGVMVMQSVIEEKNNRVLEVLVSTVRPFDMMMGKILGVASVALLQIVIWIALIAGAAYFVLPHLLPDEIVQALALMKQGVPAAAIEGGNQFGTLQAFVMLSNIGYIGGIVVWLLVFMIGGFLLYASMFAAVGSAVDSPQDA